MLVAAALCFVNLDVWPLWQDEAFTWDQAHRTAERAIEGAANDRHPPLYYLTLRPFAQLDDADWLLRLPSALYVVAAVALTGWAVRRHVGRREGDLAAWGMALAPAAVLYAHTARMYGLLLLCGAGLFASALEVARGRRPALGAVGLAASTAAALWTHYASFGGILGAGLAGALTLVVARPEDRLKRAAYAFVAFAVAGASFVPWATGPLQHQLANKDAPAARTVWVLHYLGWNFDARVPVQSWLFLLLQLTGLGLVLRKRDATTATLVGWVLAGIVFPYWASKSGPAQNPRNYIDFLPAGATLVAIALARVPRAPLALLGFAAVSIEPLADLLSRPVSPQEIGSGYHYRLDAQVLDQVMWGDDALIVRPEYLLRQYDRYVPALDVRKDNIPVRPAWVILERGGRLEPELQKLYTTDCTFTQAFRVVLMAPPGPQCDAYKAALVEVGEGRSYPPFLLELAQRELDAGDAAAALRHAAQADDALVAHPAAAMMHARAALAAGQAQEALDAADKARDIAIRWVYPRGTVGEIDTMRSQAYALLGDDAAATDAAAQGACSRAAPHPYLCGVLRPLYEAVSGMSFEGTAVTPPPAAKAAVAPTPAAPALPADLPYAPEAESGFARAWGSPFDVLDESFVVVGDPARVQDGVLHLGDAAQGKTVVVCSPPAPAAPSMRMRARWKADVDATGGRTFVVLEARPTDDKGTVLKNGGAPIIATLVGQNETFDWQVAEATYAPPPEATGVRLCFKLSGAGTGSLALDWVTFDKVNG